MKKLIVSCVQNPIIINIIININPLKMLICFYVFDTQHLWNKKLFVYIHNYT